MLDGLDHARRGFHRQPVWASEGFDEAFDLPSRPVRIVERARDLPDMSLEIVGEPQQPASFRGEMFEVQRAVLGTAIRRGPD